MGQFEGQQPAQAVAEEGVGRSAIEGAVQLAGQLRDQAGGIGMQGLAEAKAAPRQFQGQQADPARQAGLPAAEQRGAGPE